MGPVSSCRERRPADVVARVGTGAQVFCAPRAVRWRNGRADRGVGALREMWRQAAPGGFPSRAERWRGSTLGVSSTGELLLRGPGVPEALHAALIPVCRSEVVPAVRGGGRRRPGACWRRARDGAREGGWGQPSLAFSAPLAARLPPRVQRQLSLAMAAGTTSRAPGGGRAAPGPAPLRPTARARQP